MARSALASPDVNDPDIPAPGPGLPHKLKVMAARKGCLNRKAPAPPEQFASVLHGATACLKCSPERLIGPYNLQPCQLLACERTLAVPFGSASNQSHGRLFPVPSLSLESSRHKYFCMEQYVISSSLTLT
jgi:hypothetical protein